MNREQRKYTLERIENIVHAKCTELKHLANQSEKTDWDIDEKIQFILDGKATLKPYEQLVNIIKEPKTAYALRATPSYLNFYIYPTFEITPEIKDINKRLEAIKAEATRLKDTCMLGDAIELIEQLQAFEEKEF